MNDDNLNDRLNSVRDTTSQKKLKRYALDDSSDEVREIAVSKISDLAVLFYIVKNDKSVNVVKKAIQKAIENIDDEEELNNLFMELSKNEIDYDEILKDSYFITNQKVLSKLALKDPNRLLRLQAINGITNQKVLKQILLNDSYWRCRRAAAKKITNQDILVDIALNDFDSDVRREATNKIANQDILVDIALNDFDSDVRREAAKKITNQDILVDIALNNFEYSYVRREATKRITNQDILVDIALNNILEYRDIRVEAIKRITNQDILVDLALKDFEDSDVRVEAIKRISDLVILPEILSNQSGHVLHMVINEINDQLTLLELALSNKDVAEMLDEESRILYEALKEVS